MEDYFKSKLGWWPAIVLAVLGYGLPVVAIGIHYGLFWGLAALGWPVLLFLDRVGALQIISFITWFVFAFEASIIVLGWWSLAVFAAWLILLGVGIAGFRFLTS